MSSGQTRVVEFEGLGFPVWAVGPTFSADRTALTTHHLIAEDGGRDLPLFRDADYARSYIAHRKLDGYEPAAIETPRELISLLEDLLTLGECDVRFDDAYGPTPGTICYPAWRLVRFAREQFPDA